MNLTSDLNSIIPVLIKIWRKKNGFTSKNLPHNTMTPAELQRIGKSLKKLSSGLTEERFFIGEKYLDNNDHLGAYLIYFWIKSYVQVRFALENIPKGIYDSALDLGGGPGPVSKALCDIGIGKITTVDNSRKALDISKELFSSYEDRKKVKILNHDLTNINLLPDKQIYDLAVISHTLNELWSNDEKKIELRTGFIENIFDCKIKDDGILVIIEPAIMNTINDLLIVRDILSEKGYSIIHPCIDRTCCPVLTTIGSTCHDEIKWKPPALMTQISNIAGFDINPLPAGIMIIGNKKNKIHSPFNDCYRIVSQRLLSKNGKYRFFICGKEGRFTLSARKDEIISSYEDFIKLKKGDVVTFQNCKKTENGYSLEKESTLKVIYTQHTL